MPATVCRVCRARVHVNDYPSHYRAHAKAARHTTTWHDGLRAQALARDNLICQHCSSTAQLVVHHIDEDISNQSLDNLLTLCRQCHHREHGS